MWIIPKSITCPSVPDMGASTLDSEQFSQIAEQSLMWRSKPSLQRTWLRRWKRESWIRHLSIRTLDPSHSSPFVEWWTSSLEASRVNHSAMPGSVTGWTILGTSGPPLPKGSEPADRQLSFSRMSRESCLPSQRDTIQFSTMSSAIWKAWVTGQRQEYSQRKKSAPLIDESESSSSAWPTPTVGGQNPAPWKPGVQWWKQSRAARNLPAAVNWPTPTGIHADRGNHDEPVENYQKRVKDYEEGRAKGKPGKSLGVAVNWPTPTGRDWKDGNNPSKNVPTNGLLGRAVPREPTNRPGLLNPAWVETLMGLPFGWTDLGSWVMESSPKPEQKHS